jgi:hypothetical protein
MLERHVKADQNRFLPHPYQTITVKPDAINKASRNKTETNQITSSSAHLSDMTSQQRAQLTIYGDVSVKAGQLVATFRNERRTLVFMSYGVQQEAQHPLRVTG